jgi:hypothetical protein
MNIIKSISSLSMVGVLALSSISMNSFAEDLRGTVTTVDGTPLCALAIASGRTQFTCNPVGDFSFTELPIESDGTIKLQVYADGFLPNVTRLSDFSPQNVVMKRAVDCGDLSEMQACVTSVADFYPRTSTFVEFRNGAIINNHNGQFHHPDDEYVIYRTESEEWFIRETHSDFARIDVTDEPTTCFEANLDTVVKVELIRELNSDRKQIELASGEVYQTLEATECRAVSIGQTVDVKRGELLVLNTGYICEVY